MKGALASCLYDLSLIVHFNPRMIFDLVRYGCCTSKILFSDDDRDFICVLCKEYRLFCRGKASSQDKHIQSRKKFSVTGGTIGNTPSLVFNFSLKSNLSGTGAGGQHDSQCLKVSLICDNLFDISVRIQFFDFCHHKFRTKKLGLLSHVFRKPFAVSFRNPRIIDHLRRDRDLSAHLFFFYDQHTVFCPGKINGGGKPCRTSAYNDAVIEFFHINSVQRITFHLHLFLDQTYQIKTRF